jgi:hypothetical protein
MHGPLKGAFFLLAGQVRHATQLIERHGERWKHTSQLNDRCLSALPGFANARIQFAVGAHHRS